MSKFNVQKGDKINARSASIRDENSPYNKIGGHNTYDKPLTVTKTFSHGVRTKELGYIHNNNIISKAPKEINKDAVREETTSKEPEILEEDLGSDMGLDDEDADDLDDLFNEEDE